VAVDIKAVAAVAVDTKAAVVDTKAADGNNL
jgi:hypothetical protein